MLSAGSWHAVVDLVGLVRGWVAGVLARGAFSGFGTVERGVRRVRGWAGMTACGCGVGTVARSVFSRLGGGAGS
ncbi:hypothetical protein BJP25_24690 [Actinokineospora bangkokensis]|uniref:Uncharacterized protein n=1 Tax=Actinokineospora bangkokensis TaxID=1193682 RepID=A0A1Q9LJ30_9PSEU|nr:hypothetical protein BJP25_24690 [Actinokineospora bangkokensis]